MGPDIRRRFGAEKRASIGAVVDSHLRTDLKAPFLILETGQPVGLHAPPRHLSPLDPRRGGLERDEAVVANVERGDALPPWAGFAGVIVTGSGRDGHRPA
jgi:hypothetical protein